MSAKLKHLPSVMTAATFSASAWLRSLLSDLNGEFRFWRSPGSMPLLFSLSTPTASTMPADEALGLAAAERVLHRAARVVVALHRRVDVRRRSRCSTSPLLLPHAASNPTIAITMNRRMFDTHLLRECIHATDACAVGRGPRDVARGTRPTAGRPLGSDDRHLRCTGPGYDRSHLARPPHPAVPRPRRRARRAARMGPRPRARRGRVPHGAVPRAPRSPRRRARAHHGPPGAATRGTARSTPTSRSTATRRCPGRRCGSSR